MAVVLAAQRRRQAREGAKIADRGVGEQQVRGGDAAADGKAIRFLNINDTLADSNGMALDGVLNPDRLHLSLKGYQIWADALKPIFTELLGPPAATDSAPPPTGDPSAGLR